jgi:hypothetical protein
VNFILSPKLLAIALIVLVFAYTIQLVRTDRLSAHLAISWIMTECVFFLLCMFDWPLELIQTIFGDGKTIIVAALLGVTWMAVLMLDSLVRISALTAKLKDINQELALVRSEIDRQTGDSKVTR